MILWGGQGPVIDDPGEQLDDGAAYDPASDRWRRLPAAPLLPGAPLGSVWTGSRFVVFAHPETGAGGAAGSIGAFDPATWEWQTLPPVPDGAVLAITRHLDGVAVLTVASPGNPSRDRPLQPSIFTWSSGGTEWQALPSPPEISGDAVAGGLDLLSIEGDLVVLSPPLAGSSRGQTHRYGDRTRGWTSLEPPPDDALRPGPVSDDGERLVLFRSTEVLVLAGSTWSRVELGGHVNERSTVVHTGEDFILWGPWTSSAISSAVLSWEAD